MRDDRSSTKHITSPSVFFEYLRSGKYKITSWDEIGEEVIQLQYRTREEFIEPNPNTNVVLAA
jgi:hypothetical protein